MQYAATADPSDRGPVERPGFCRVYTEGVGIATAMLHRRCHLEPGTCGGVPVGTLVPAIPDHHDECGWDNYFGDGDGDDDVDGRGWAWSDQVCRCGGPYGTLARYKEALLEGTITPRYYIERLPALLYEQGYIHMVQVCRTDCLIRRANCGSFCLQDCQIVADFDNLSIIGAPILFSFGEQMRRLSAYTREHWPIAEPPCAPP